MQATTDSERNNNTKQQEPIDSINSSSFSNLWNEFSKTKAVNLEELDQRANSKFFPKK